MGKWRELRVTREAKDKFLKRFPEYFETHAIRYHIGKLNKSFRGSIVHVVGIGDMYTWDGWMVRNIEFFMDFFTFCIYSSKLLYFFAYTITSITTSITSILLQLQVFCQFLCHWVTDLIKDSTQMNLLLHMSFRSKTKRPIHFLGMQ